MKVDYDTYLDIDDNGNFKIIRLSPVEVGINEYFIRINNANKKLEKEIKKLKEKNKILRKKLKALGKDE